MSEHTSTAAGTTAHRGPVTSREGMNLRVLVGLAALTLIATAALYAEGSP